MEINPKQQIILTGNELVTSDIENSGLQISEIYLDGKLKRAESLNEEEKSYGIFMHSLTVSNYAEVMKMGNGKTNLTGDEFEKAIYKYTSQKGFDPKLMQSIAPKIDTGKMEQNGEFKLSVHAINDTVRIISKGTPNELLKRCTYLLMDSKIVKITRRIYKETNEVMHDMLMRCSGVYAVAIKDVASRFEVFSADRGVQQMTLVALIGVGRTY